MKIFIAIIKFIFVVFVLSSFSLAIKFLYEHQFPERLGGQSYLIDFVKNIVLNHEIPNLKSLEFIVMFIFGVFIWMTLGEDFDKFLKRFNKDWKLTFKAHKDLHYILEDSTEKISKYSIDKKYIQKNDEEFSEILLSAGAEIYMDKIDPKSIVESTKDLEEIIKSVIEKNHNIEEIFAVTNLRGKFWKTRTMLIYLLRTIQIASYVTDDRQKMRVFQLADSDDIYTKEIESLHKYFLPIKYYDINNYPPFLYIKGYTSDGRMKETFFAILKITHPHYKYSWSKLKKNHDNIEFRNKIRKIVDEIKKNR